MSAINVETKQDWGTALLRIAVGITFAAHGAQKLFAVGPVTLAGFFGSVGIPFPLANAYLIIAIELLGGLAMIAGLGTRIIGALFAATMVVAFATVHGAQGFFLPNGFEFVFVLFAASIALVLQGSGAFALDAVVARRRTGLRNLAPARA